MVDDRILAQAHPAFRFVVQLAGRAEGAFTECTLPAIEWETEEVREGGLNVYTHVLPGRRRAARITLKNGVGKQGLLEWYLQAMSERIVRKPITVQLLDSRLQRVMTWQVEQALPVRWLGPQLQADASALAIQTLEFACGEIKVVP